MSIKVPSPCIGLCTTALGDDVCRGCARTRDEVDNWITYTEEQKAVIDRVLEETITTAVNSYVRITNPEKFHSAYDQLPPKYNHRNNENKAYILLTKVYASKPSPLGLAYVSSVIRTTVDAVGNIRNIFTFIRKGK
jgi:predicted Fe-S protein YdhL (DUF1289 family)